jgi:hypothetical protein
MPRNAEAPDPRWSFAVSGHSARIVRAGCSVMAKSPKLAVLDVGDVPLREVSGLACRGSRVIAVGDHEPVLFSAETGVWPLRWTGTDLSGLGLPDRGVQFEAIEPVGRDGALVLQEQPARVLHLDLASTSLVGEIHLEIPEGHRLREAWLGDRSSRGESLVLTGGGHLLVVKEKDPAAILEFGPSGATPIGWQRGRPVVGPARGAFTYTALATWSLDKALAKRLPDISDATVGPDGRLYLLSDQGSSIARLPDLLDPTDDTVGAVATWRIAGEPDNAEGMVILDDGTPLVGLDTKAPRKNLLRLERLPLH